MTKISYAFILSFLDLIGIDFAYKIGKATFYWSQLPPYITFSPPACRKARGGEGHIKVMIRMSSFSIYVDNICE